MGIEQDNLLRMLLANRAKVVSYIRSIVRDEHLAEDVFQDVSIIAVNKKQEIESEAHFLGWVRKTARLEALNALRKQDNSIITIDQSVLDLLEENWQRYDQAATNHMMEALGHCVDQLTPNARNILNLRYSEGLSGQKLASTLNRKVNTVYVAISRIHAALHECIQRRVASQRSAP